MTHHKHIPIGQITCGNDLPLTVIAGPCQLESLDHALMIAETMAGACADAGAQFVFKASYDKANRTSLSGRRGLGIEEGLQILATVGAITPFIGLFGTVWGIMRSFQEIAISGNTSLATVAPGIAEALLATGLGLLAAIPAVIIYNMLSADA